MRFKLVLLLLLETLLTLIVALPPDGKPVHSLTDEKSDSTYPFKGNKLEEKYNIKPKKYKDFDLGSILGDQIGSYEYSADAIGPKGTHTFKLQRPLGQLPESLYGPYQGDPSALQFQESFVVPNFRADTRILKIKTPYVNQQWKYNLKQENGAGSGGITKRSAATTAVHTIADDNALHEKNEVVNGNTLFSEGNSNIIQDKPYSTTIDEIEKLEVEDQRIKENKLKENEIEVSNMMPTELDNRAEIVEKLEQKLDKKTDETNENTVESETTSSGDNNKENSNKVFAENNENVDVENKDIINGGQENAVKDENKEKETKVEGSVKVEKEEKQENEEKVETTDKEETKEKEKEKKEGIEEKDQKEIISDGNEQNQKEVIEQNKPVQQENENKKSFPIMYILTLINPSKGNGKMLTKDIENLIASLKKTLESEKNDESNQNSLSNQDYSVKVYTGHIQLDKQQNPSIPTEIKKKCKHDQRRKFSKKTWWFSKKNGKYNKKKQSTALRKKKYKIYF